MYAIIKTGGKQLRVSQGDLIDIERLPLEVGKNVTFDQVYMVENDGQTVIGSPLVKNAKVIGEILMEDKSKKVISFKFKRRKGYKKMIGHRQFFTRVKITEIHL